ncbi:hypothetical protein CDV26_02110 [Francisella halioticida]|uniref:DUF5658 domain-containing protein n=1 Tax=Francisella halioticida TaxID=549298 RepID=A0ABM6LXJ3_9GAMM|nr:hypothetical protein [Francisella halioticida]ASG67348.1 hypothetical protein CDV26_02110 [Francisella halioticida]
MKKIYILLDYILKNLFMAIFWFVSGLIIGYITVYLTSSEHVYNILKGHGFIWTSIYGAIKVSGLLSIIFAIIFAIFDENKKFLIVPMIVTVIVLYFIQHLLAYCILGCFA